MNILLSPRVFSVNKYTQTSNRNKENTTKAVGFAPNSVDRFVSFCGSKPVYAVTPECKVIKFQTTKDAAQAIGIKPSAVHNAISQPNRCPNGYVFVRENRIIDESGAIDYKKVKKIAENIKAVCSIDSENNIVTYASTTEASRATGVPVEKITMATSKGGKCCDGLVFVRRKLIEDEEGNLKLKKAHNIWKKATEPYHGIPFYIVDADYNATLCCGARNVAKTLGVSKSAIADCARGAFKTLNGYALIRQELVLDEDGEVDFAKLKLEADKRFYDRKRFMALGKNKLVGIQRDGSMKFFNSIKEANAYIGSMNVSQCLQNLIKTTRDWTFIELVDLLDEKDAIDKDKVSTIIKERFSNIKPLKRLKG